MPEAFSSYTRTVPEVSISARSLSWGLRLMWLRRPCNAASTTVIASLVVSRKPRQVGLNAGCALTIFGGPWGLDGGGAAVPRDVAWDVATECWRGGNRDVGGCKLAVKFVYAEGSNMFE